MSGILAATVGGGVGELVLNITSTVNPDISARLSAAGWLGKMQKIRIVSTGLVNALSIPASLDGADITLDFSPASFVGGTYNSGTALKTRAHVNVINAGTIAGGGGAGNRGGNAWVQRSIFGGGSESANGYGGAPGDGQGFAAGSLTVRAATAGQAGTVGTLAARSVPGTPARGSAVAVGGDGGAGGGWGSPGQLSPSRDGGVGGDYDSYGATAGSPAAPAGKAVDGNSYITWISTGTRLGGIT